MVPYSACVRGGQGIQAKMVHFADFYPKMRHFWAIFWSVPPQDFSLVQALHKSHVQSRFGVKFLGIPKILEHT